MKRYLALILVLIFVSSCAELQHAIDNSTSDNGTTVSNSDIALGLRQALDMGIERQVTQLTQTNGFYGNDLVRIGLPRELTKIERTLRDIGLNDLADKGIIALNRAAEDAVKEAIPIFTSAVQDINFNQAKALLMGKDDAATTYLKLSTETELYNQFHPIIEDAFADVGANELWTQIINRYNALPMTQSVNPDLTDYVTQEALNGVFTMIAVEEQHIRQQLDARTTAVLRQVFALQD